MSCKHKGRAFLGRRFHAQADTMFGGFTLRDDWVDWVIEHYVQESSPESALRKRQSIQDKIDRARHLYIEGELDWQSFSRIKEDAEAAIVSVYVPEFDDAMEAGKILNDFGTLWHSASVARRDRLLRSMLQAIYVDLEKREITGLLPKKCFLGPLLAMAERKEVAVLDGSNGCSRRSWWRRGRVELPVQKSP